MPEYIKKILGSGDNTSLAIPNKNINDIIKIVQALEESNILLKGVTETVKNETKEQKGGFLSMLLGTLGASLLGNLLTGKEFVTARYGNNNNNNKKKNKNNKKGKGIVRAGYGNNSNKLKTKVDF